MPLALDELELAALLVFTIAAARRRPPTGLGCFFDSCLPPCCDVLAELSLSLDGSCLRRFAAASLKVDGFVTLTIEPPAVGLLRKVVPERELG